MHMTGLFFQATRLLLHLPTGSAGLHRPVIPLIHAPKPLSRLLAPLPTLVIRIRTLVIRFRRGVTSFRRVVIRIRTLVISFRRVVTRYRTLVIRVRRVVIRVRRVVIRFRWVVTRFRTLVIRIRRGVTRFRTLVIRLRTLSTRFRTGATGFRMILPSLWFDTRRTSVAIKQNAVTWIGASRYNSQLTTSPPLSNTLVSSWAYNHYPFHLNFVPCFSSLSAPDKTPKLPIFLVASLL